MSIEPKGRRRASLNTAPTRAPPPRLSFRAASLFEAHGQLAEAERRRLAFREQLVQHLGGAARHALPGGTTAAVYSWSAVAQKHCAAS